MKTILICSLIAMVLFGASFYFFGMPALLIGILGLPVAVVTDRKKQIV